MEIRREAIVDELELGIIGEKVMPIAYKGHVSKVVEISDLDSTFLSHKLSPKTLKTLFWAGFDIDYLGW